VDWLAWAYLLYGGFSLHYLLTSPTLIWRPEEKFVLPPLDAWGWIVAALITVELALLCRAFGLSLGMRAFGFTLARDPLSVDRSPSSVTGSRMTVNGSRITDHGSRPTDHGLRITFARRALYFLTSQASIVSLGIETFLSPSRPWHERWSGVRLIPVAGSRLPVDGSTGNRVTGFRRPWYLTNFGIMALLIAGLTLALGWQVVGIQLGTLIRDVRRPIRMWRGLTHPDFTYLVRTDPGIGDSVVGALVESLLMALLATVGGALFAFPLSFFGARNIAGHGPVGLGVYGVTRGLFNVFRSVESIFWASIFAIWVGFGPFAGTMALFIHTIAALGKLYSEQVEHIDPGPVEAVSAMGASRLKVIRYAVIPQIVPPFLAFTLYRWDINLRMATVVALVGGGGIGRLFFYYKDDLQWHLVGAVVVGFAITVWLLDYVSGWVRERIT
jgi:phosphonate transport system permease protein